MNSERTAISPTRSENFADWYQEVIQAADLAENSVVRGCMIIKPNGYELWERIQTVLDRQFKATGHRNAYFPLLIPLSFLQKEAAHVEGFAKECAVVTHYRLDTDESGALRPAPSAELAEPMIIRPTSETIIGNAFSKWIRSYNDLPLLLNQWANVMRWEMRPRLFLRTSEFLWQEGHTAHGTEEEARGEATAILDLYANFVTDYLAVPVIKGEKSPRERFPGAVNTYTIEAMMQDGRALQAGTSHFLGQNFSKAYDIRFTDRAQQLQHAWTTSWGMSTRLIGALIMAHGDDDGLVLPPAIAPTQVVIIPVARSEAEQTETLAYCEALRAALGRVTYRDESLRVSIDRSDRRGGDKFWSAVKAGVPVRVEVGPREVASDTVSVFRRIDAPRERRSMPRSELVGILPSMLEEIQRRMIARATDFRTRHTHTVRTVDELHERFGQDRDVAGFASVDVDVDAESDPRVTETLKALRLSVRCIPFETATTTGVCMFTGAPNGRRVVLARSY